MLEPLEENPLLQFQRLWERVARNEYENGQMMTLATANSSGRPSSRIVLFKEITESRLVFYTNYESRKAQELAANPMASGVVYWPSVDIQVRLDGRVERLSESESDAYFASRARSSQLGAWASRQSAEIASRDELEKSFQKYENQFGEGDIPRPENWGGYSLTPDEVQFLHRQPHRLHDSFRFCLEEDGWRVERLAP